LTAGKPKLFYNILQSFQNRQFISVICRNYRCCKGLPLLKVKQRMISIENAMSPMLVSRWYGLLVNVSL